MWKKILKGKTIDSPQLGNLRLSQVHDFGGEVPCPVWQIGVC